MACDRELEDDDHQVDDHNLLDLGVIKPAAMIAYL
jgi:hypothetical protein